MTASTIVALQRNLAAAEVERLRLVALIDDTTDVLNRALGRGEGVGRLPMDVLAASLASELRVERVTREQLVAAEREACAALVLTYGSAGISHPAAECIAAAIRAQGTP